MLITRAMWRIKSTHTHTTKKKKFKEWDEVAMTLMINIFTFLSISSSFFFSYLFKNKFFLILLPKHTLTFYVEMPALEKKKLIAQCVPSTSSFSFFRLRFIHSLNLKINSRVSVLCVFFFRTKKKRLVKRIRISAGYREHLAHNRKL